jgi:hypothetical protein
VSEHFEKEGGIGQRQTVMLSATLSAGVEKLAGLTLNSPELVNMNDEEGTESSGAQQKQLVIPTTLKQSYIIVPAKLRLVTLAAFILWKSTVILLFPYLSLSICTTLSYLSLLFENFPAFNNFFLVQFVSICSFTRNLFSIFQIFSTEVTLIDFFSNSTCCCRGNLFQFLIHPYPLSCEDLINV